MANREIIRHSQKINALFAKVDTACGNDLELRSHWARYLCVLVSGFLEVAIGELYRDFVRKSASEPVANYASKHLGSIQNPNGNKFVDVARAFKSEWGTDLLQHIEDNGIKDAIDSVMSNRHQIAHGKDTPSLTIARVKDWFDKAGKLIEYIEQQTSH